MTPAVPCGSGAIGGDGTKVAVRGDKTATRLRVAARRSRSALLVPARASGNHNLSVNTDSTNCCSGAP
jgi:hypothetical protein